MTSSRWTSSRLLMQLIEVNLMACGGSPDLDYADAASFLRKCQPMIDVALKRRINSSSERIGRRIETR